MATFASIATRSNGDEILAGWFNDLKNAGVTVEANAATTIYSTATSYTILNGDGYGVILVTDTAADRTITLPSVSANSNRVLKIKNTSSNGGNVIVDGASSETIDGALTVYLRGKGDALVLHSDGSEWKILGRYDASKSILSTAVGYTVLDNDGYKNIFVTNTAATRTVTLPTAADNKGRKLTVKNTSSDGGLVTIDGEGSETIDGELTLDLPDQYDSATLLCNGTAWSILNKIILSEIGSGGGTGVNNLSGNNTNFNTSLGDWADFDDYDAGSPTLPTDLTGGAASQLTMALNTSTPLDGDGSMRITHAAADCQGEGKSVAVTARVADKGMAQTVEFEYLTSTPYADGDLECWIYDVTNSKLIQPVPYKVPATGGLPNKFKAQFQNSSDSTSYIVGLFCPNTTATAYTFDLDNVRIGPSNRSYGVAGRDWKSYTPTLSDATNVNYNSAFWRRVGDTIEVKGRITWNGAGAGSDNSVSIPSGLSIDTAKLASASNASTALGIGHYLDAGTDHNIIDVVYNSTTTVRFYETNAAGAFDFSSTANGDELGYSFSVPISGWSSTVVQSDSEDGRVCAAIAYRSSNQSHTTSGAWEQVQLNAVSVDTHAQWDITTDYDYTITTSGYYNIAGSIQWNTSSTGVRGIRIYKNGATDLVFNLHAATSAGACSSWGSKNGVYLEAGDTIEMWGYQTSGGALLMVGSESYVYLSITKVSGPSAIQASELVAARVNNADSTALADVSTTYIGFASTTFDSHGCFKNVGSINNTTYTSTTYYEVAVSGKYQVNAQLCFVDVDLDADERLVVHIRVDGTARSYTELEFGGTLTSPRRSIAVNDILDLNAGDKVSISAYHAAGAAVSLDTDTLTNWFAIHRLGF